MGVDASSWTAEVPSSVEGVSSVKEGDSVELRCSSDSNPAAHSYRWHNSRRPLPTTGPTITLENVTRLTEALFCTAISTEGQGQSSPLKLNVEYISMVTCLCIVDSEPPGTVEWSLPSRPLPTLPSTRVERHGSVTMVTLQRALGFSETIHCHAINTQGNATLSFTVSTNENASESGPNSIQRKVQKDTSNEIHTNYFTNDHLYGNMEAEEVGDPYQCDGGDDAVYANV
ncbi:unnamed protein product [Coregonus sp. 'balchen']|nr:unnamed protein product [Coregonus sp. 'balchen']